MGPECELCGASADRFYTTPAVLDFSIVCSSCDTYLQPLDLEGLIQRLHRMDGIDPAGLADGAVAISGRKRRTQITDLVAKIQSS